MSGRNFSLTDRLSGFIDKEVASGRHQNASEVVREALRRYEDDITAEHASLAVLEKIAKTGIAAIESARRPIFEPCPPASAASAATPVKVMVSTVVVRSGTASFLAAVF